MSRLSLDEVAELARRHRRRAVWLKRIQAQQDADSATILAELDRRRRTQVDHGGVTVTKTSKRYGYQVPVLRDRLKPAVLRRCLKQVADATALRKELKAGTLTPADLDAAELRSEPWVVVTVAAEQGAKAA